jgi:hypothetical protein
MALSPKFALKPLDTDAQILVVTDITGDYSDDNSGGYGEPNPFKSDVHWNFFLKVKTKGKALTFDETDKIVISDDDDEIIDEVQDAVAYSQVDIGGLFTLVCYGVLAYSLANTPADGEIYWDYDNATYVIITDGLPVPITFENIDKEFIPYQVTSQYFYPFELNKAQGEMLETLPATDGCKIDDWLDDWMRLEKDAQIIKIYACRGFYNNALLVLAEYQNKIITDNC